MSRCDAPSLTASDSTTLYHSALFVRGPRTSQQSLLLESLHNRQHHRRDSLPDHNRYTHLGLLLLPRHRYPRLWTSSHCPSLCYPALHLRQLLCPDDHRRVSRRRDRRSDCDAPHADEHGFLWCTPATAGVAWFLDFHVSRLALYVLDRRHCIYGATWKTSGVCREGNVHFQPSFRPDLRRVPRAHAVDGFRSAAEPE